MTNQDRKMSQVPECLLVALVNLEQAVRSQQATQGHYGGPESSKRVRDALMDIDEARRSECLPDKQADSFEDLP